MVEKDTDPNFKNLIKSFKIINNIEIKAGHFEKNGKSSIRKDGKVDNIGLAIIHNFGCFVKKGESMQTVYHKIDSSQEFTNGGRFVKKNKSNFAQDIKVAAHSFNIPARPFTRPAFDKNETKYNNIVDKTINSFLETRNYSALNINLNLLGKTMQQDIQQEIRDLKEPALSPLTIKRKGSSKLLIDTGEMLNATDYQVEMK